MLRTGESDLVLITTQPLPSSVGYSAFIEALVAKLRSFGLSPLVHFDDAGDVDALLQTFGQLELAGFIDLSSMLLSQVASRRIAAAGTRGIVMFSPGAAPEGEARPGTRVVKVDMSIPGQLAVEHLAARGYRSVLALGPSDPALGYMAAVRMDGARRAADQAGLKFESATTDLTSEAMDRIASELVAQRSKAAAPDAVFAYNDDFALMLVRSLLDRGLDVPGDVAVIGCDNTPVAELIRPQLSSVDLAHADAGAYVAELLRCEISGTPLPEGVEAPTLAVVARAST
jgi:DNA-binding LacI/PurR family transcriptional regulator